MLYSGEHAVHSRRNLESWCARNVKNRIKTMASALVGFTADNTETTALQGVADADMLQLPQLGTGAKSTVVLMCTGIKKLYGMSRRGIF